MDILKKRLREKAEKRFGEEFSKALLIMQKNDILKNLVIGTDENKLMLCSSGGVCYSTDLFHYGGTRNDSLLRKKTNFNKTQDELTEQYEKEETDEFLNKINDMRDYWQEQQ